MNDRFKFRGIVKLDTQNIVIYSSILKYYDDDLVLSVSESDGVKQIKDAGYKLTDKDWDEIYRYSDQDDYYPWFNFSCERVEQCTGLKDKNGKLIYENDLIKCPNGIYRLGVDDFGLWTAIYENNPLKDVAEWSDIVKNYAFSSENVELEVLGNIHENADLIKVGEK